MTDTINDLNPSASVRPKNADFDVIIVGAGFSGMYMLHKVRSLGLSVRAFERGSGVGGTWYWNSYPGARVDTHSIVYSYGFDDELQQEWEWSETYAAQPELLRYANHVADRYDLRRDIQFDTTVTAAAFDDEAGIWRITLDSGKTVSARYYIMASGILSVPKKIDVPGLDSFRGELYFTNNWPKDRDVELAGKRVGVVGTGSSGIQVVQTIASTVDELFVFQRTPNFAVPMRNAPTDPERAAAVKANYPAFRAATRQKSDGQFADHFPINESIYSVTPEQREAEFERRWAVGGFNILSTFNDLFSDPAANEYLCEFFRRKIRETVHDPRTADLLTPHGHTIGSRRLMVEMGYYEAFNRDNVHLVDLRSEAITEVTPNGLATEKNQYDLDVLIFATGFDGETGPLLAVDITGTGGVSLREKWSGFPKSYLGVATSGFPNMFIMVGPGSPAVLTNVIVTLEYHAEWIANLISYMETNGIDRVDAKADEEDRWAAFVISEADKTIFPKDTGSGWIGANIPGKPRYIKVYVGGLHSYITIADGVAARGYEEFTQVTTESIAAARK